MHIAVREGAVWHDHPRKKKSLLEGGTSERCRKCDVAAGVELGGEGLCATNVYHTPAANTEPA